MSDKNSFNHEKIETHSFLMVVLIVGMSLGGYLAIRMATHDTRVRAVAAVSRSEALATSASSTRWPTR